MFNQLDLSSRDVDTKFLASEVERVGRRLFRLLSGQMNPGCLKRLLKIRTECHLIAGAEETNKTCDGELHGIPYEASNKGWQ